MSLQVPITFLDLCQRTQQDCGVSGNLMSTTVSQIGGLGRIVSWVSSAWIEVQGHVQDYDFFRATATWATDTNKTAYSPLDCGIAAGTFSKWSLDSFRVYTTSAGTASENYLSFIHYDEWRNTYFFSALRTTRTLPLVFSVAPDKSIVLGPIASSIYTIIGDYFIAPQPMVNDGDTPSSVSASVGASGVQGSIPSFWNMMVVYRAMMSYGAFEHVPEIYNFGERFYNSYLKKLLADRLPEIRGCGALC